MLDYCSISHKGGVVLWSKSFTPATSHLASSASPVNSLIREALIEGRNADESFERDGYAVKWSFFNGLELIFVVAYQRILQLTYIDEFLAVLQSSFIRCFAPFLTTFVESLRAKIPGYPSSHIDWDFGAALDGWDATFNQILMDIQARTSYERRPRVRAVNRPIARTSTPPSDQDTAPALSEDLTQDEQQISRNVQALRNRLRGRGTRRGTRGRADLSARDSTPNSDTEMSTKRKTKAKAQRKWGDDPPSENEGSLLDYSDQPKSDEVMARGPRELFDQASLGTRTREGMYEVKDWVPTRHGDNTDVITSMVSSQSTESESQSFGTLGNIIARITGSKVLTETDLRPILEGMKHHLMKKNVAKEIAEKVCEGVGESLLGQRVGGFQSTGSAVRAALGSSITRILTPKTSTDLLLSIRKKLSSTLPSSQKRIPYSITFVGVNGVGKSTNLSKVCFWLIQNGLRVLIAACDTFRSGAVEQLRVHVRNLSTLGVNGAADSKGRVELFERGYGKDAAGIAKDAMAYARDNDFDVVLIDTAGRMQDNEPLMRALAKLVAMNSPDKIIFVGEALVGNEAVDQLTKFDRALRDFSSGSGLAQSRGIDGMLVTKWDTVDDKVGAALSMTYVTGQPIIFVGCGQTYTDLRQLRVGSVVQAILGD